MLPLTVGRMKVFGIGPEEVRLLLVGRDLVKFGWEIVERIWEL